MFYAVKEKYPLKCVLVYNFVSPNVTRIPHSCLNMPVCLLKML